MVFSIFNKKKDEIARIEFHNGGVNVLESTEDGFKSLVEKILAKEEFYSLQEDYDGAQGRFLMRRVQIVPGAKDFPRVFKEFLEGVGYVVIENRSEIEEKIQRYLNDIPNEDADKKRLMRELPVMNYLEKTALLKKLEEVS